MLIMNEHGEFVDPEPPRFDYSRRRAWHCRWCGKPTESEDGYCSDQCRRKAETARRVGGGR